MPPRSSFKKGQSRKVPVRSGDAHFRTIDEPSGDQIITEKMTRERVKKLPHWMQIQWKKETLQKVLEFMPGESEQASMTDFFNRSPSTTPRRVHDAQPGPSSDLPPTHVAGDGSPAKKKKKKCVPPVTPEGLTPSRRDGKNASIYAFSPYA